MSSKADEKHRPLVIPAEAGIQMNNMFNKTFPLNSNVQRKELSMKKIALLVSVLNLLCAISVPTAQEKPRTMYVMNALARTISKMNMDNRAITNDILIIGTISNRILTRKNTIYIVNTVPPEVMIIDGRTESIERRIPLPEGSNPWDMAFTGTHQAYVTNFVANTISIVNLGSGTVEGSIDVGEGPEGILVVGNTAYVANTGGWPDYTPSTVSIIDMLTNSVTKTLNTAMNPQDFALAPDGRIHVLCSGIWGGNGGHVYIIDPYGDIDWTPVVVDSVLLGGFPGDIAITSNGIGYATDWGDDYNGFLYSYNVSTGEILHDSSNPIRVGKGAMRLLWDEKAGDLYVSNFDDNTVQRLDPSNGTVLETYNFGHGTQDMAILEPIFETDPWADDVVTFTAGTNWSGFGENFFPDNVLGPPDPDPTITVYSPSSKPQEILSLGHGGEVVLEFTDNVIVNGEGVDFTVFENPFYFWGTEDPFVEAGIVSVSMDGTHFHSFAYDTITFEGFAGVTPTMDNQHPTDPDVSGGDSFDIAEIGLTYVRFVKITDAGDVIHEGPFNGDFDLDAVVAVHSENEPPHLSFKGDANGDSIIDIADIVLVSTIILNQHQPDAAEFYQGDCNGPNCEGDGTINVLDAIKIVNIILELEECP